VDEFDIGLIESGAGSAPAQHKNTAGLARKARLRSVQNLIDSHSWWRGIIYKRPHLDKFRPRPYK
jgi:hypothetical protein